VGRGNHCAGGWSASGRFGPTVGGNSPAVGSASLRWEGARTPGGGDDGWFLSRYRCAMCPLRINPHIVIKDFQKYIDLALLAQILLPLKNRGLSVCQTSNKISESQTTLIPQTKPLIARGTIYWIPKRFEICIAFLVCNSLENNGTDWLQFFRCLK